MIFFFFSQNYAIVLGNMHSLIFNFLILGHHHNDFCFQSQILALSFHPEQTTFIPSVRLYLNLYNIKKVRILSQLNI